MREKLKKYSIFQITSVVLLAILIIAIVVELIVIINLKIKINELNDKNSQIPATESVLIEENKEKDFNIILDAI